MIVVIVCAVCKLIAAEVAIVVGIVVITCAIAYSAFVANMIFVIINTVGKLCVTQITVMVTVIIRTVT